MFVIRAYCNKFTHTKSRLCHVNFLRKNEKLRRKNEGNKNPPSPNTLVLIKRINQRKYIYPHTLFAFLPFEKRERGRERERERGTKQRGWVDVMFRASPVPDGRASVSPVCSLSSERRSGNARRKVSTTTCRFRPTRRRGRRKDHRNAREERERQR